MLSAIKQIERCLARALPILNVIGKLITHIQNENFKMVGYYGIYSRNMNKKLEVLLIILR